jgi:hypothetical protein
VNKNVTVLDGEHWHDASGLASSGERVSVGDAGVPRPRACVTFIFPDQFGSLSEFIGPGKARSVPARSDPCREALAAEATSSRVGDLATPKRGSLTIPRFG